MSSSLTRLQAVFLGLVVLVGMGLLVTGSFLIASKSALGANPLGVIARFDNIRGIEVGTRVRIQGIDAGEVTQLQTPRQPHDPVLVNLAIKNSCRHLVRSSSRVQIISEGMLGGKVLEILPSTESPKEGEDQEVAENTILDSLPATEINDLIVQASKAVQNLQSGPGTLARLASDSTAHDSLVATLQQFKETAASIQQVSESMQKLPLVGGYLEHPVALLERPECTRESRVFSDTDLFESSSAILTPTGKERLDQLAIWLNGIKNPNSEIVIASYSDPAQGLPTASALITTRKQSQVVCDYLKNKYAIQKMGWFSTRKVSSLGLGNQVNPGSDRQALPPARLEVHVFIPVRQ